MKFYPALISCLIALTLMACTKTANLYPANKAAAKTGVLQARYKAYGTGHTNMTIKMPNGEILKGETSLVRGGTIGFGSIIASVHGDGGSAYGSASSTNYTMQGGSPGTASMFGNKGTYGECEFYNDNFSGHG